MTTVYLVDDHAIVRDGLRAVLEAAGHRVVGESSTIAPVMDELARLEPDILVLDLSFGQSSGLDLLADLQRRPLPTRTIVLSMSAQPRHVAEALRLDAFGYVLKGASASEVTAAIDDVTGGRRHLGAGVADLAVRGLTARDESAAVNALAPRERQVVYWVVRGRSSVEIGEQLHLSSKTVDTYRSRVMAKLGVNDVPALVRLAIRVGIVNVDEV